MRTTEHLEKTGNPCSVSKASDGIGYNHVPQAAARKRKPALFLRWSLIVLVERLAKWKLSR